MQIKLYEARKQAKLSQEEVADYLGISRVAYGKKERGQAPFQLEEMFALGTLLEKGLEEIFLPRSNQYGYNEKQNI